MVYAYSGIVYETVLVEISPGDSFLQNAYLKQSWTCAVDQNRPLRVILPVFETVPPEFCDISKDC